MEQYLTIRSRGSGEYEEKKSRFLGEAIPVSTEEDVRRELEQIRKRYYDAKHHCYAYVIGEKGEQKKASDDGEPSGTAGLPILKVIGDMTNVLIVVTRYFGGTLLGTGGLVRSYTQAAKAAILDAGTVRMESGERLRITMEYSLYDRVIRILGQHELQPDDTVYTDKVSVLVRIPVRLKPDILLQLQETGSGTISISSEESGYYLF